MKSRIIRIGNSQGVRIPKPLLEQCGLDEQIELEVRNGELVIRPAGRARAGWEDAFVEMAQRGEDALEWPEGRQGTTWDEEEWEW